MECSTKKWELAELLLECEGIVERKSVDEADEGKRCCIFVDGKEHACF